MDRAIDKAVPRKANKGHKRLARAAAAAVKAHPRRRLWPIGSTGRFGVVQQFHGRGSGQRLPLALKREQNPPGAYRVPVSRVALERVALGGYRLAAMLEELFGQ